MLCWQVRSSIALWFVGRNYNFRVLVLHWYGMYMIGCVSMWWVLAKPKPKKARARPRGEVVLRGYDYTVIRHFVEYCEACYFSSLFDTSTLLVLCASYVCTQLGDYRSTAVRCAVGTAHHLPVPIISRTWAWSSWSWHWAWSWMEWLGLGND